MGVNGQRHTPAALYPRGKNPCTHCTGGWVGPRAGLDTEVRGNTVTKLDAANNGSSATNTSLCSSWCRQYSLLLLHLSIHLSLGRPRFLRSLDPYSNAYLGTLLSFIRCTWSIHCLTERHRAQTLWLRLPTEPEISTNGIFT
jgi:hypothetical protein